MIAVIDRMSVADRATASVRDLEASNKKKNKGFCGK